MRLFLYISGALVLSLLNVNCQSNKRDSSTSSQNDQTYINDSIQLYASEAVKVPASQLTFPNGIRRVLVEPGNDKYKFLHDPADDMEDRKVLAIAISKDADTPFSFSRIYKIQSPGPGKPMLSHYPCVLENEGNLYVVYTANFAGEEKRQCELAIIPIKSLR